MSQKLFHSRAAVVQCKKRNNSMKQMTKEQLFRLYFLPNVHVHTAAAHAFCEILIKSVIALVLHSTECKMKWMVAALSQMMQTSCGRVHVPQFTDDAPTRTTINQLQQQLPNNKNELLLFIFFFRLIGWSLYLYHTSSITFGDNWQQHHSANQRWSSNWTAKLRFSSDTCRKKRLMVCNHC